jgi:hypothetical protein
MPLLSCFIGIFRILQLGVKIFSGCYCMSFTDFEFFWIFLAVFDGASSTNVGLLTNVSCRSFTTMLYKARHPGVSPSKVEVILD